MSVPSGIALDAGDQGRPEQRGLTKPSSRRLGDYNDARSRASSALGNEHPSQLQRRLSVCGGSAANCDVFE
jgi:hypothetical protein